MAGILLAHVEELAHGDGLAVLVRLGPTLGIGIVLVWVALAALPSPTGPRDLASTGAAAGFGLAGLLHLYLVPSHADESVAAGVLFGLAGLGELGLAGLILRTTATRALASAAVVVIAGLLAVYAASRVWDLRLGFGSERVDAVGIMSKVVEVAAASLALVAASGWRPRLPAAADVLAALAVATALAARSLFGLGPEALGVAAAVGGAVAVQLVGRWRGRELLTAAGDGALLALVLRADTPWWALLAGGAAASAVRLVQRTHGGVVVPAVPAAALAVLWTVPRARFEILHVSHPDDTLAAASALAIAAAMTTAAWRAGRLPILVAFLGAHLGAQALRLWADRTSLEAVEVPGFSLGLFLLAALTLASPPTVGPRLAVAGALAVGLLDVALRDLGVAYAPLVALTFGGLLLAAVGAVLPERNASPVRNSAAEPRA
ncbi:MAG: hypothetical protein ACRDZ1_07935 [Acidimicrobiia bacterium]